MEVVKSRRVVVAMMMSMLLLLLISLSVESKCDCCVADRAKACCFACIAASDSDSFCKNTCCFPCFLSNLTKGRSVQDFCKLGCVSSACADIAIPGNQTEHENGVNRCHDACHQFCNNKDDANLALGEA